MLFWLHRIVKLRDVGDKPLVKFPPMNKRSLTQLLPGIITNSDRQVQTDARINFCNEQMHLFFNIFVKEKFLEAGWLSFLATTLGISSKSCGNLFRRNGPVVGKI